MNAETSQVLSKLVTHWTPDTDGDVRFTLIRDIFTDELFVNCGDLDIDESMMRFVTVTLFVPYTATIASVIAELTDAFTALADSVQPALYEYHA